MNVVSEGTYQGTDGTTYAYKVLSATRQRSHPNFARAIFGYKRTADSEYTLVPGALYSGLQWRCKIEGLIPGATYDFIVYAENAHGILSDTSNPTLQEAALGDTTAPGKPTGASVSSPTLINAIVSWTNPSNADFSHTLIYRHTSDVFGSASVVHSEKGGPGNVEVWADTSVSEDTTYYYWLVAVDYSGNESDKVAAGSVAISDTFSVTNISCTDLTATTITTENLNLESSDSEKPLLELKNTNADQYGPIQRFLKESGSEADDDVLGITEYKGYNDAGTPETIEYVRQQVRSADVTDGDEAGEYKIFVMMDGTLREIFTIDGSGGGVNQAKVIVNQDLQDVDFIVGSNLLLVDGGDGNVTINGAKVSANYDLMLAGDGILGLKESGVPTADSGYGKVWTTSGNIFGCQTGDGNNHVFLMTDSESGLADAVLGGDGITIVDEGDGTVTVEVKQQAYIGNANVASVTDPADSPADADALRDDLVANTIPSIETELDNHKASIDAIRDALVSAEILAAS